MPTQFYPDGSVRQAMSPEEAQQQAANEYAANRPWDNRGATPIYDMFGPVATGDPRVEDARAKATQTYDRNIAEGTAAARMAKPRFMYGVGNLDSPEKIDAEVLKPFREAYGLSKEMKFKPTAPTSFEQHTSLYEKYLAQANAATDPSQKQHYQELSDMTKKLMEKDSSFAPRAPDKPDRPIKETIAAGEDQPQIVKSYTQAEWDARPIQNKNELDLLSKYAELKSKVAAGDMKLGPDWNPLASERTVQLAKVRTQLQQLGIDAETGKRTGSLVINPSSGTLTNAPTLGAPPPFAPAVVAANVTQKDYESLKPGDSYWWNGKKIPKK